MRIRRSFELPTLFAFFLLAVLLAGPATAQFLWIPEILFGQEFDDQVLGVEMEKAITAGVNLPTTG